MEPEKLPLDADTRQVIAALRQAGEIWEARLGSDWMPPPGSPFPWAQVRLSLAALVPELKDAGAWRRRAEVLGVGCWVLGETQDTKPLQPTPPNTQHPTPNTLPTAALILAGNTPLMSWSPLCACLLAGWRVRVKMSRGETVWPRLFWDTLNEVDPDIAARVSLDVWPANDPRTTELVQDADAVVAFGSDTTLAALGELTPTGTPFFGFGHAVSIGLLMQGYTPEEWRGFARDVLMYNQGGCLSPHLLLEDPTTNLNATGIYAGKDFARELFDEADLLGVPPVTDPAVARRVAEVRDMAAFEGLAAFPLPGTQSELRFTVICDYAETPPVLPDPAGHGTVYLLPCNPHELPQRLGSLRGRVSCVGVAGELPEEVRAMLIAEGVSRICPAGEMQTPPLDWPNGNVDLVAELRRVSASPEIVNR